MPLTTSSPSAKSIALTPIAVRPTELISLVSNLIDLPSFVNNSTCSSFAKNTFAKLSSSRKPKAIIPILLLVFMYSLNSVFFNIPFFVTKITYCISVSR